MGLYQGDLRNLVHDVFEIDTYKSKMGDDHDIVTLSFEVSDKEPANDLVQFIESGYEFVLDADATEGEQQNGKYKVFVELERGRKSVEHILEIIDGIGKLANIETMRFRYHKNFRSNPVTKEELEGEVPTDPDAYDIYVSETNLNNFKNFFNRSFVDSVDLTEDVITIRKVYSQPLRLQVLDFGDTVDIIESLQENINFNDWSEVIYLTKYLGDYNITKYGQKLTIENGGKVLVAKRL